MKTRLLIVTFIIIGVLASTLFFLDSMSKNKTYLEPFQFNIESDFKGKIKEIGDNSVAMTFLLNSKNLENGIIQYCGFAHMENQEYWYFANTTNHFILDSYVTQDISPFCQTVHDSCYCELRGSLGLDIQSYEDFFRNHVSSTCPIEPMPPNVHAYDPVNCKWVLQDEN